MADFPEYWETLEDIPTARGSYDLTATVKLSPEQAAYVKASDEPVSQWIRGAVQERIDRENNGLGWPEVHPSEHPGLH